jgi:hypothetical protein
MKTAAGLETIAGHERLTCPKCRQPMRLLLVKGEQKRKYRCIDCDGEDPLYSRAISKLLQTMQPPT